MFQNRPNTRMPLPSLQTDLSKTTSRQRTYSTYSAYSPNHITPSSFESQSSATDQLIERPRQVRHSTDDAYYPGRPIFGVPHAIKTPDVVAKPRRNTLGSSASESQGASPPPAYISSQHSPKSPTSPTAGSRPRSQYPAISPTAAASSRRASNNYSYPRQETEIAPVAAVGARSAQRRPIGQHDRCSRPAIRQVQSDCNLTSHEPRRRSEPIASQPIHEIADHVPELSDSWSGRQRQGRTHELRGRAVSGSAVDGHTNGDWGRMVKETVESINAAGIGWGGDMRTDRERERDLQFQREREWEREMELESQTVARTRGSGWP